MRWISLELVNIRERRRHYRVFPYDMKKSDFRRWFSRRRREGFKLERWWVREVERAVDFPKAPVLRAARILSARADEHGRLVYW